MSRSRQPAPASFVEDFAGPRLDPARWVDHYLPHWTTPERSRARFAVTPSGLQLRIEADQPDWRPEDAPLRVSNLQTATFAGDLGSARGTHRHRSDGLVVRTAVPLQLLWAPRAGQVDVTVTASTDRACMLAAWLVGTEHLAEQDSGEICLFEIDADAVGADRTTARVGVKAHGDPRLVTAMTEVEVPVGRGRAHTWSARWDADGVLLTCDGQVVHASAQRLTYPLQLMVDLFEIGPAGPLTEYPKSALVHRVSAGDQPAASVPSHFCSPVRQSGVSTTPLREGVVMTTKQSTGFSDAEKAAMKARAEELRSSGRTGAKKADEAQACLDAIAAMTEQDRVLAERVHTLVSEAAPGLRPKTWYGFPAYVDENAKVVCFFKPAAKFGVRYATLGFSDVARLDDGDVWPTEYAVTSASGAAGETIAELLRRAVATAN